MLTFEAIRDLERGESESKTLQKLPDNFLGELQQYLGKKEAIQEKSSQDIHEIENIKRSIRRLFELREKKLVDQALYTVRTGYSVENLTSEEERLYAYLVEEMKKYREKFFQQIAKPAEEKKTIEVPETVNPEAKKYRILRTVPKFIGPDMNVYELKESHVIEDGEFPKPLNDLLLKKGLLEVIS